MTDREKGRRFFTRERFRFESHVPSVTPFGSPSVVNFPQTRPESAVKGAPTTPLASNSSCFRLRDILSKLERPLTAVVVLFKAAATIMVDLPFAQSARRRLSSSVVQAFRCGRFISL
jgi:hypothetical protein